MAASSAIAASVVFIIAASRAGAFPALAPMVDPRATGVNGTREVV